MLSAVKSRNVVSFDWTDREIESAFYAMLSFRLTTDHGVVIHDKNLSDQILLHWLKEKNLIILAPVSGDQDSPLLTQLNALRFDFVQDVKILFAYKLPLVHHWVAIEIIKKDNLLTCSVYDTDGKVSIAPDDILDQVFSFFSSKTDVCICDFATLSVYDFSLQGKNNCGLIVSAILIDLVFGRCMDGSYAGLLSPIDEDIDFDLKDQKWRDIISEIVCEYGSLSQVANFCDFILNIIFPELVNQ